MKILFLGIVIGNLSMNFQHNINALIIFVGKERNYIFFRLRGRSEARCEGAEIDG